MTKHHSRPQFTASADGGDATTIEALAEAFEANNEATATALQTATATIASMKKDMDKLMNTSRGNVASRNGVMTAGHDGDDKARRVAHKAALGKFMATGDEAALRIDNTAAASMMVQDDPAGGYLVPTEVSREIYEFQRDVSPMRRLATVRETTSSNFGQPVNKGGTAGGWISETDPRPQTDAAKLALLNVPSCELYAMPAATQKLLDDAPQNVAAWLEGEIVTTFAEIEGLGFITGSGVERPLGLLSIPIVAQRDAVRSWGQWEYLPTGVGGGFVGSQAQVDALIDIVYRLKAGYRRNASWLMNSATGAAISKFKDTEGNLLWRAAVSQGQPATLLGYPVEFDENMPDIAVDSTSIAFGDFKRGYLITDRIGVRILRDPYSNKPFVMFYATKRVGGCPMDTNAIKFLKFSAS